MERVVAGLMLDRQGTDEHLSGRNASRGPGRMRRWLTAFRLVGVSLALMFIWSLGDILLLELPPLAATAGLVLLLGAFIYLHWLRPASKTKRKQLAAVRLRPLGPALGIVLASVLVYLVFDHALVLVYVRVIDVPIEESFLDMYKYGRSSFGWFPVFVSGVLIAPVFEETVFRGWIQRPLERDWGVGPAIALAAILFAVVHLTVALIPYYFIVGIALGIFVHAARSLWAGIWLHGVSNASALGWELGGLDQAKFQGWADNDMVLIASLAVVALTAPLLVRMVRQIHATARPLQAATAFPRGG